MRRYVLVTPHTLELFREYHDSPYTLNVYTNSALGVPTYQQLPEKPDGSYFYTSSEADKAIREMAGRGVELVKYPV